MQSLPCLPLLLPFLSLLFLPLLSPGLTSAQSQPTSWSQVSITSVTSPNCTQSGAQILNCPFPVRLLIQTTGWGGLSASAIYLVAVGPDGTEIGPSQRGGGSTLSVWGGDGGANATLQGTLFPQQFAPTLVAASATAVAPLLNLTIRTFGAPGGTVPPFPGISFAYDAGPTLTSISGCTGSGASTTNCVPASTVLTFQGSGFRWYSNPGAVQLWINTGWTYASGGNGFGQPSLQVLSDSVMTLNLANAYTYTLLPVHYGGVLVPIFFNEQRYAQNQLVNSYTNALQISFIPQPAPVVTSVTTGGYGGINACQGTNGTGPYTNCIPLVSYIAIFGQYMYDVTVTVGGTACPSLVVQSAGLVRCLLPLMSGVGPYTVVVSDPTAQTTAYWNSTGAISYTSQPTINSVTTCTDTGAVNQQGFFFGGICSEGSSVSVSGANFPVGDAGVTVTATWYPPGNPNQRPAWGQSPITITLTGAAIISSTAITATLPYLATLTGASINASLAFYGATVQMRVSFTSAAATNNLNLQLYAVPNAPAVSSVTGCSSSSAALLLTNCASGSVLTITGTNLGSAGFGGPYVSPVTNGGLQWTCSVTSATAPQILCTLPTFDLQVTPVTSGTVYPLSVSEWYGAPINAWTTSNAFRLSFSLGTSSTPSSSSSSLSTGAIVAIAVVIPLAGLAIIAAVACLLLRSEKGSGGGGFTEKREASKEPGFGKQVDDKDSADVEMQ